MAAKKQTNGVSFEETMKQLEAAIVKLESPDVPLEDAVKLYREAHGLLADCRERLERARHEVSVLNDDGSLSPLSEERE